MQIVPIAMLAFAAAAAWAEPAPRDPLAVLEDAERLLDKTAFAPALELLSSIDPARLPQRPQARYHQLLALAQSALGQYDQSLRATDDCERLAAELRADDLLARIESTRSFVWSQRGFRERALGHAQKSLERAEASGEKRLILLSLRRLSQVYTALDDWTQVLRNLERQLELDPDPTGRSRLSYLVTRGVAHYEFHERDLAAKSFEEALAIGQSIGARELTALASYELAKVYWDFDRDRPKALGQFEHALAEASAAKTPHLAVSALNEIGNVYRDSGEPARALASYRSALALERARGAKAGSPYLIKNSGQVLVRLGRREEGERLLLQALALADELKNQRIRWQSRMELARLYSRDEPARADRYFSETLDIVEAQHSNVLLDDLRAANLAVSLALYDPYDLYIDFLLAQGRPEEAFRVGERARARAFLALLGAAREQVADVLPPRYLESEKEILSRISQQQAELRTQAPGDARRDELMQAVRRDEERLTALRVRLAAERPQLAQARYPKLWSVEELRSTILKPGEALAVFFVGKQSSVCWLITRERLETIRLPDRAALESVVRESLQGMSSPGADARAAARRLHDTLAAPLVEKLPEGWRLLVVPHAVLNYVPLETALDPAGRYLIERHPVSYAPSASSLAYLRGLPSPPAASSDILLAVGDPVVGASATPATDRTLDVDMLHMLKPLRHAGQELRSISALFAGSSQVLAGGEATEAQLARVDGRRVRVLHFATHGLLDDRRPERSALALTAAPPADDGLLQAREVFRLRLDARLVTLSACQTALGKELTGEGLVGLARAFFYAGAHAVMASLWSVNDASTARWMADFYGRLRAGDAIDEAARAAKIGFIRSGGSLSHPHHWALFVVTGNAAGPIGLNPPSRAPLFLASLLALAASAYYITARVRRRRVVAPKPA